MDLRTQSDIMGNLRAKGLAIMSLNVTPSVKSKDWAKWSVVLAYNGKKRVKVLDFRHPKGSWFPTDVATTLLQRHEISHKCKVAPFCTTQKRTLLHCTKMCFYYISSNENLLTILTILLFKFNFRSIVVIIKQWSEAESFSIYENHDYPH